MLNLKTIRNINKILLVSSPYKEANKASYLSNLGKQKKNKMGGKSDQNYEIQLAGNPS